MAVLSQRLTWVIDPEKFEQYHVVITTYGTVQSEFNADPGKKRAMKALFAVKWWRIVLGNPSPQLVSADSLTSLH